MSEIAMLLAPPDDHAVALARDDYREALRQAYGARLVDLRLFGSRARGDYRPDSDADIAVILSSFENGALGEKMKLVDLGFDAITDRGLMIQPWPFTQAQWDGLESAGRFTDLLAAAHRDSVEVPA